MVTATQSAILLLLIIMPLGFAASAGTIKSMPGSLRLGLWILLGSNLVIIIWVGLYLNGKSFSTIRQILIVVWILSVLATISHLCRKRALKWNLRAALAALIPLSVFAAVIACFYLVPRTYEGQITQRQLMGPDAIGYANASAGLLEDGSFDRLESVAIAASSHGLLYELFDQDIKAVYMIPDKSLSIKTEFLVGSLRIGFPSLVATVTSQLGLENILSALHVTAAIFLLAGALLLFSLTCSRGISRSISLLVISLSLINVNLLVGYHEGGVAQAFVYSAVAAFLVGAIHKELSPRIRMTFFVCAGVQVLSSYLDMFFVFLALIFVWLVVSQLRRDYESLCRGKLAAWGMLISVILLAPISLELPRFLLRRLADARQGGWNWDSWTELGGIIGISNPYFSVPDSIPVQLVLMLIGIVLFEILRDRNKVDKPYSDGSLVLSLLLVSVVFYIYSRYVMNHNTYQWFKLTGTLIGPFTIPLLAVTIATGPKLERKKVVAVSIAFALVAILGARTSIHYVRYYFGDSLALAPSLIEEISSESVRDVTSSYQVFGHYGWQEIALTPFWPAMFLNRDDGRVRPIAYEELPVGLMVRESDCPQWNCLAGVSKRNLIPVGTQYMIVDLELAGAEVRQIDTYTQWLRVNRALAVLGAPYVEGNWTDLGPQLRFKD